MKADRLYAAITREGDSVPDDEAAHSSRLTMFWNGQSWVPVPPPPITPEEAQERLDEAVEDALADGFTVESQDDDGYIVSRPIYPPWLGGAAVLVAVLIFLFWSLLLGLLLVVASIIFWSKGARRRTRISIYVTPTGRVVQEEIYKIRRKVIPTTREIEGLRDEADALDEAADADGEEPWTPPEARTPLVPAADAPATTGPVVQEPVGSMLRDWWQKYLNHRRNV